MPSCIALYTYELPVHSQCCFKGGTRKGVILECLEYKIYAEAAPLAGYSKESTQDVLKELSSVLHLLLKLLVAADAKKSVLPFLKSAQLSPSSTFAIYSLFTQLHSPLFYPYRIPLRSYIDIPYQNSSSITTLLRQLATLSSSDIAKIKLGSYPLQEAISLMRAARKQSKASLHLDFNGQWSLQDALAFSSSFPLNTFAALEDPVNNLLDLNYFAQHSPHPLAIDHLLRKHSLSDFLHLPHLYSVEFKPTLDMHLLLESDILHVLSQKKIHVTFSSSYETSVGIAAIGRLGAELVPRVPLGVDTLSIFSQDLLSTPLTRDGHYFVLPSSLSINKEFLTLYETASLSCCSSSST